MDEGQLVGFPALWFPLLCASVLTADWTLNGSRRPLPIEQTTHYHLSPYHYHLFTVSFLVRMLKEHHSIQSLSRFTRFTRFYSTRLFAYAFVIVSLQWWILLYFFLHLSFLPISLFIHCFYIVAKSFRINCLGRLRFGFILLTEWNHPPLFSVFEDLWQKFNR